MTWRDHFRPIIRAVLERHAGESEQRIRAALREAWDHHGAGERKYWPYKVWLDEVARQRAVRGGRKTWGRNRKVRSMTAAEAREWLHERQLPLVERGGPPW